MTKSLKTKRILYAFGHQHLGWTLGAVTGSLIENILKDQQPNINIEAFSPSRF